MKLKKYAEALSRLAKEYPNLVVIAASDDEGNSFSPVNFAPSVGHYDGDTFGANSPKCNATVNAVCLN